MSALNLKLLILVLLSTLTALQPTALAAESSLSDTEITIIAHDGTELDMHRYPAKGKYLLLWVASSYSMGERVYSFQSNMAQNGVEVWRIDFSDILFQPRSSNFLRNLNAEYVADIISAAHKKTGKQIILMARSYGSIPVLRGATLWQQHHPGEDYLTGIVLFSPDLYQSIPDLGLAPEYLPVTRATTIPLMIYQSQSRGTYGQFPRLLNELRTSNNSVYFSIMSGVAGIFYPSDTNKQTLARLKKLPTELPAIFNLLEKSPRSQAAKDFRIAANSITSRVDTRLKPFKGKPTPPPIQLHDINTASVTLEKYKGQVTVVNFWATWCAPCVYEIPSLNRLRAKMKNEPFKLISVNYAESPGTVRQFLKRVNVEFPVLMDTKGQVSSQWNVIAFPSTFVIGADGNIHYGVNAAIEWDSPEVINKLKLLN